MLIKHQYIQRVKKGLPLDYHGFALCGMGWGTNELQLHHWMSSSEALLSLAVTSSTLFPTQYIVVSSAYIYVDPEVMAVGKSLVYSVKSVGPRTEPCGMS